MLKLSSLLSGSRLSANVTSAPKATPNIMAAELGGRLRRY